MEKNNKKLAELANERLEAEREAKKEDALAKAKAYAEGCNYHESFTEDELKEKWGADFTSVLKVLQEEGFFWKSSHHDVATRVIFGHYCCYKTKLFYDIYVNKPSHM